MRYDEMEQAELARKAAARKETEARMEDLERVTLSVDDGALWRSDREHGRRLVATCVDMAERIAHRWNTWSEMMKALEDCAAALGASYDATEWPADGSSEQEKACATARALIAKAKGDA